MSRNARIFIVTMGAVLAGLSFYGCLWWNANPVVSIPTLRMPSPNAFDDYKAAGKAIADQSRIEAAYKQFHASPTTSPAGLAALVTSNAQALKLLRRGFAHPYLNPPSRSLNDTSSYYRPFRNLARLLVLEGQDHAAHKDWDGAVNSDLDAIRLGADLPQGSVLIGDLVGIADQAIGRYAIWPLVDDLSAPQARQAARRLEAIKVRQVPFSDVLQQEKWFGQAAMMEVFRNPKWRAGDFWHSKRMSMNNYTQYMDRAMEIARLPYAAGHEEPPMPPDFTSSIMLPVLTDAGLRHTESETKNALLMTALALRAYRLENKAYPATLDALAPEYLTRVPDDPFALSGAVHYRRTGDTFVLYSVGPDGKDDGGAPICDTSRLGRARYFVFPESRGDIVAGRNP